MGWSARGAKATGRFVLALPRVVAVLVMVTISLAGASSPAAAHTNLTSATPEPQSSTKGAPAQVQLHFGWPPVPDDRTKVAVIVPSGRDIAQGTALVTGQGVAQRLLPSREMGWYRVRFTVAFVNGHVGSGVFRFRVTTFDRAAPATAPWKWTSVGLGSVFVAYVLVLARRRSLDPQPT